MPSYKPVPGKRSAVLYGGDSPNNPGGRLPFRAYDWEGGANLIDVTGSACLGYGIYESGLKHLTLTLAGIWDANRNPFSTAPAFKIGQKLKYLTVQVHGTVRATTPTAIVTNFKIKSIAEGLAVYVIQLTGTYQFNDTSGAQA